MSEHHHLNLWSLSFAAVPALIFTALLYLRGWVRLRTAFPNLIPAWRLAAFMTGLFSVWIAAASPLAALDHQSLTMHMVKHLLLMTVAAPLILAGAPAASLLAGLRKRFIPTDALVDASLPEPPVLCWLAATATVIGWHLPAAFQLAMRSHWVHGFEDISFLLAGFLFWCPVMLPLRGVTRSPRWSVVLYLFLATVPCDILGAFLAFCNRLVYPSYLSTTELLSLSPLQDQECAGALMWVWVTFAYLVPAVVKTMQILSPRHKYSCQPTQTAWQRGACRDGLERHPDLVASAGLKIFARGGVNHCPRID